MSFWDRLFGAPSVNAGDLAGFRRMGGQIFDVYNQLNNEETSGRARAYINVARGIQVIADKMVEPYLDPPKDVIKLTHDQALALYQQIPDLVTAAKQEAIDEGGRRDIALPYILSGRLDQPEGVASPPAHLQGMLRGVQALCDMVEAEIQLAATASKGAKLYLAEATTNRDSASYMVAGLLDHSLPQENHEQAEKYLWLCALYALAAVQELYVPNVFHGVDVESYWDKSNEPTPFPNQRPKGLLESLVETVQEIAQEEQLEQRRDREWEFERRRHHHHSDRDWF